MRKLLQNGPFLYDNGNIKCVISNCEIVYTYWKKSIKYYLIYLYLIFIYIIHLSTYTIDLSYIRIDTQTPPIFVSLYSLKNVCGTRRGVYTTFLMS